MLFVVFLVSYQVLPTSAGLSLAFKHPAIQSSRLGDKIASLAVDGDFRTNFQIGNCTHTKDVPGSTSPWWRVNLGREYYVSEIRVTNRGDCCGERLSGFTIRVGNSLVDNGNNNSQCGGLHSVPQGQTLSFHCTPPLLGRYVNIQIPGSGKILTLCEVLVNPPVSANLALSKPTSQSSRVDYSSYGVDGFYLTDVQKKPCTETSIAGEMSPWWRVDLGRVEPVSEVYLVNRGDCAFAERLWNIEVRIGNSTANGGVSNTRCGNLYSIPCGKAMSIFCDPRVYGIYVYVRRPGVFGVLSLCEAAVYSESRPLIVDSSPKNMTAFEGEAISLKCEAPSFPRPQVIWKLNGAVLPYIRQTINKVASKCDSGTYECAVSSIHGQDMYKFNLQVKDYGSRDERVFLSKEEMTALFNHVIYNVSNVPDVVSCTSHCMLHPECVSFNFMSSLLICQLNNATTEQFPQDLHQNVPFSYYYETVEINVYSYN